MSSSHIGSDRRRDAPTPTAMTVQELPPVMHRAGGPTGSARRSFTPLRVERVVTETADAASFDLGVLADAAAAFVYRAGQFVTVRVAIDGEIHHRSYSMSSSPALETGLRLTVKRVPGGLVSNWLVDRVREGDVLEVSTPSGGFVLADDEGNDVVAFAAGSGITPVFSIVTTALATSTRTVRVLYANHDLDAVIFRHQLAALAADHPERMVVEHHLDVDAGFVTSEQVARTVAASPAGAEYFVCGPTGFMDVVEGTLRALGVGGRVHVERFTPAEPASTGGASDAATSSATTTELTMSCNGRSVTVEPRPGTTVLQTARAAGLRPPSSCESGSCATCMAMLVEGHAEMRHNEVLTDEEVAAGWVLTCQALPTTPSVRVVYE